MIANVVGEPPRKNVQVLESGLDSRTEHDVKLVIDAGI
jgi:hypothetical protein